VLVEDLGLSPGPELRRLEAAILAHDPLLATPARVTDPTRSTFDPSLPPLRAPLAVSYDPNEPCVGRDHDLARLAERWEHTHHGNQHAIFIVGEPGIGKTRLTAEFAQRAAAEGAVVLFGRCDEDVLSPFQPFVEAVRDLIDRLGDARAIALHEAVGPHLARLIPGLAPTVSQSAEPKPEEPSMLWFVDALASLLAELAANTPLLLILDDVHWADSTTVAGLRHVMRRNRQSATLILGTYRAGELHADHPLADLLADLRSDRSCERLALAGLEETAIAELLTDAVPDPDQRGLAASRLRRETEGNPLFIGELLRHFADERDATLSDRLLLLGAGAVPEGITEVIARRLHRVSEPCQTVLRLASILGINFSTPVLRALAVGSVADVFAALDEAERAGIVREDPDSDPPSYAFTHTLVRRTLYDGTSRARRQQLHAAAAQAITATVGRDDRSLPSLASHHRLAGSAADPAEAASVLLDAAALQSRGWAKAEAADLYAAALELLPASESERRRFATLQRSVNLQAAWHARFDQQSIRAVTAARPVGGQDA
jgi:predicted ATPase